MCDLPTSQGAAVASAINSKNCIFVPTDITQPGDVENALSITKVSVNPLLLRVLWLLTLTSFVDTEHISFQETFGRLDATVNCAGIGVAFKVYNFNKERAHSLEDFAKVQGSS